MTARRLDGGGDRVVPRRFLDGTLATEVGRLGLLALAALGTTLSCDPERDELAEAIREAAAVTAVAGVFGVLGTGVDALNTALDGKASAE